MSNIADFDTLMRQAPETVEVYLYSIVPKLRIMFPKSTDKELLEALPGLVTAASIDYAGAIIAKAIMERPQPGDEF